MNRGKYSELFKPERIGTAEVPNRIVVPPMATNYATEKRSFQISYALFHGFIEA